MQFLAFYISFGSFPFVTLTIGKNVCCQMHSFFFKLEGRRVGMRIILILSIKKSFKEDVLEVLLK